MSQPRLVYTNAEFPLPRQRTDNPVGQAVRRRRETLKMTVGQLAASAGLPRNFIQAYENGEWRIPRSVLLRMADALDAADLRLAS